MNEQPTALRLADELADYTGFTVVGMDQAAAELRRLHAENVLLHERHHFDNGVLAELLEALKRLHDATWLVSKGHYNEELHDIAVSKARAVIAKTEGQV
jgi:hypothetical protein